MAWIEKRKGKRGNTYRVAWRAPDGTIQKSEQFRRRADADTHRRVLDGEHARGQFMRNSRITLAEYWESYLNRVDEEVVRLSPTTRRLWWQTFRKHIEPVLGNRKLTSITRPDVRDLIGRIQGPRAQTQVVTVLRALLYRAQDEGILAVNVAARMRLAQDRAREPEIATIDELRLIAEAVPARFRAMVLLAAFGALRPSEVFAVQEDRVDWLRRRVLIDQRLVEVPGGVEIGPTKTRGSTRTVVLPEFVMEELAEHVRTFPPDDEHGLLFTTEKGMPIRQTSFGQRVWRPSLAKAGITKRVTFQNLRHTGASLVHAAGFTERDVADRLGHTSTRMAARYVKTYEERQDQIADALQDLGSNLGSRRARPEGDTRGVTGKPT